MNMSSNVMVNVQTAGNLDVSGSHITIIGGEVGGRLIANGAMHVTIIGLKVMGGVVLKAGIGKGVYHVNLVGVHVGFEQKGPEIGFQIETSDRLDFRRSNHIVLQGCTARWCRTGFKLSRCAGVSLVGVEAEACNVGLDVDDCEAVSIHGGHFEANSQCDIWIGKGSYRTKEFGASLQSRKKFDGPNVQAGGNDLSVWRDSITVGMVDGTNIWGKVFKTKP